MDSFIGLDGKQKLTEGWSVSGAFLHYWTPQWRSAIFGSYAEVSFGSGSRAVIAGLYPATATGLTNTSLDARLRDYSVSVVGANLIWSPIRDLDIGLETIYTRVDLRGGGRVADLTQGTQYLNSGGINYGVPGKTVKYDDVWSMRMRVQRDF